MIQRILDQKIKALSKKFPVVAISGPRQSGKTVLSRAVFSKYRYVSLEDIDNRQFAQSDPRRFLSHTSGLIIDEIQRVPQLLSYMQTVCDQSKKNGLFVITGSQNILMHQGVSQTLAGRVALVNLLPLSMEELAGSRYEHGNPDKAIYTGFYPRIYDKKIDPKDWYYGYIQTYVEKDIRLIKNIGDLDIFQRFLKMCAARIGQIVNLTSLANDCGITHNTAKAWLSVLQATYIIFLVQPHYRNFNKRLIKMPKLYFYDTGLACALLNIHNETDIAAHYLRGGLFESLIISEMMKYRANRGLPANCYYWRDKIGNEIDCVIEEGSQLIPVEIKSGMTINSDYFKGLNYWNAVASNPAKNAYVVYSGNQRQERSDGSVVTWKDVPRIFERHEAR